MAIYKQNGFKTKQMALVKGNKPLFEMLQDYEVIDDTTDLEKYKEQIATYIIVGEMKPNDKGLYIRSNANLISRDYAFLDYDKIDIPNADFINLVADKLQGYEYLLYPTIRHTEENPRYRLILPLERPANDKEYKSTIQSIADFIGLKNDSSSATFSQLQGTPVVRKSQADNYKIIHTIGEKFPVSEVKEGSYNILNNERKSDGCIEYKTAIKYFTRYVERNRIKLEDYNEYIKPLMVLVKGVLTGEIEIDTATRCAEILALGNKENEINNITHLYKEIRRNNVRTQGTFKTCFIPLNVTGGQGLELATDKDDKIIKNLENFSKMVRAVIPIAYNDYTKEIEIIDHGEIKTVDNEELAEIRLLVERAFNITIPKKEIYDVVLLASKEQNYNPVQDIIKKVKWDGIPRAETLFIDFLGVEDNVYNREMSKKILLASVYRNFETNVKFDEILILHGSQGMGKSTILERLAFGKYYVSLTDKIDSKDTNQQTLARWIVEHEELATVQKTSSNTMKAWLSSHNDTYRLPYARTVKTFPRRFVNFGTTNQDNFLKDYTGNRRYLILECDKDRVQKIIWETDDNYFYQLWAEVYEMYRRKESIVISEDTINYMQEKTKEYILRDEITEFLTELLEMLLPENWSDTLNVTNYSVKPNRNDLKKYINEMIKKGVSDFFKYDDKTLIQDITAMEVVEFIKLYLEDVKLTDRQLQMKISNFFSGLEGWERTNNIKRYKKRKKGYKRK